MKKVLIIFSIIILMIANTKVYATEIPITEVVLNSNNNTEETLIKGAGAEYLNNSTVESANTYIKITTSNELVYCTDANEEIYVGQGEKKFNGCHYITGTTGRKVAYILSNGYSGTKKESNYTKTEYLTGEMKKDYYITQAAIWYHTEPKPWMKKDSGFDFNLTNGTIDGKTTTVITKMMNLINDAEKAGTGATLTLSNITMSLTNDGKYFISNAIKLTGTYLNSNITATVLGAKGAFVTADKDANSGTTTFSNNSTIYIKVPSANITSNTTTISLTIKATTLVNDSSVIECENEDRETGIQPLAIYYPTNTEITTSKTATITKYPVKITKKDITSSEELEGATLTIKNSNGTVIDTWVSNKDAKTFNLTQGTYTIEETIAPDGYIKSTSKIEFTIESTGKVLVGNKEVSEIVITNEPILISISKRSITGSDELKGAKLKITDKNGNIVKDISGDNMEWTSTEKAKTFQLKMGDYILSETIAPEGYELSETTIEFTINGEGKILIDGKEVKDNLIIFENTPEPKQVPTGNTLIYVAGSLCLVALGVSIYIIIKRKEL